MAWRIVQISSACKLSLKHNQLLYEPSEGEAVTLPLEDIAAVILENKQILLTSALLSKLAEYGICLFSLGGSSGWENHLSNGIRNRDYSLSIKPIFCAVTTAAVRVLTFSLSIIPETCCLTVETDFCI